MQPDPEAVLDTIIDLATRMAQRSPDCAEDSRRIAEMAVGLRQGRLDKGALRDALASTTVGDGMSDADVSATVERAVLMEGDEPE